MSRRLFILLTGLLCGCGFGPPRHFRDTVPDPVAEFNALTHLNIPATAQVVSARDTHGGFVGDGELSIVLQVDGPTINALLSSNAPWDVAWLQGPVPEEISLHCMDTPQKCRDAMDSENIRYSAKDSKQCDLPWHNGRLVVLDPTNRQVILSRWDF